MMFYANAYTRCVRDCTSWAGGFGCLYVCCIFLLFFFFFSSRRRHTRYWRDWSSDVCSSDLTQCYIKFQRLIYPQKKFMIATICCSDSLIKQTCQPQISSPKQVTEGRKQKHGLKFNPGFALISSDFKNRAQEAFFIRHYKTNYY